MTEQPPYFNDPDAIVTAAYHGEYDNVAALIARGADPNARDENGNTGIIAASEHGCDAIVELLVAGGGDVNARNNDGDSALDLAGYRKAKSTVVLLQSLNGVGRDGPSAKEQMEDAFYDACQVTNNIKSGMFSGGNNEP